MRFGHGIAVLFPLLAAATPAGGAPLDSTPDTLVERAELLRDARERPWDPATGRLGNLRHAHLVAPGCTVRVISGAENRVYRGRGALRVEENRSAGASTKGRNVTITAGTGSTAIPSIGDASGPVCFTLQLATAHLLTLQGDGLAVLFDRVELPALDIYLNPGAGLKLWFQEVRLGFLRVHSNAWARAGGTGQVEWLTLRSSQQDTALWFHDMDARHVGVGATTIRARFSIRIGPGTEAVYEQPARAPGEIAKLYPIWVDGPVPALKVPSQRVDAMPLTDAVRQESRALREEVLARAGPRPALPPGDTALPAAARTDTGSVSPRQRVADVLQPLLPPGVTLGSVQLWQGGAALEGRAPDAAAVRRWVQELALSGEVRDPSIAFTRPESGGVAYRVLVHFLCAAPGEPSVCLAGSGNAYTQQQVEDALRPVLGPQVTDARIALRDGWVELEGRASEADAQAALDRIGKQLRWLQASTSVVGRGAFRASLRMACTVPPRPGGICVARGERGR